MTRQFRVLYDNVRGTMEKSSSLCRNAYARTALIDDIHTVLGLSSSPPSFDNFISENDLLKAVIGPNYGAQISRGRQSPAPLLSSVS